MTKDALPPEIGPHEGRELDLMLAGEKPAAMFCDCVPASYDFGEKAFAPHVREGRLLFREEITPATGGLSLPLPLPLPIRHVYYALPGEAWRMERLARINRGFFLEGVKTTPELEREIGHLLGYSEKEISVYLDRLFGPRQGK